jgi:octaprenyl-diphosphate synthase
MDVIYRKTARLFEAGAQIAAIVAKAPAPVEAALARYGRHLGIAFQLIDDALDYQGDAGELGKNAAVERSGGLEYTATLAAQEAGKAEEALAELPASPYRDALAGLARFAVSRTS